MPQEKEVSTYRNSPKRFKGPPAIFFITTNTYGKYPYFAEDVFCESFLDDLQFVKKEKPFLLYGYKINDDHIHMMLKTTGEYHYSEIMHNLKRVSSLHINQIIFGPEVYSRVEWTDKLNQYRSRFLDKHPSRRSTVKFKWKPSFHDRMIRGKPGFQERINYLRNQWVKHHQPANKYCFIDENLHPEPIDFGFPPA